MNDPIEKVDVGYWKEVPNIEFVMPNNDRMSTKVMAGDITALGKQVEVLEKIVARLPKYADTGAAFVPSVDSSYAVVGGAVYDLLPAYHADVDQWLPLSSQFHDGFAGWYSTFIAAQTAAAQEWEK